MVILVTTTRLKLQEASTNPRWSLVDFLVQKLWDQLYNFPAHDNFITAHLLSNSDILNCNC